MTSQYNKNFVRLSKRIEKAIITGIIFCFVLLASGEFLLEWSAVREVLVETERLEGVSRFP
jgi:hypothetical protein